jgi:orotate phosphoribosyltransferase
MTALAHREVFETSSHKKNDELRKIIAERSFKEGIFTLSSGKQSSLYFNMKPTMMCPRGAQLASEAFIEIILGLNIEYVGGLEMGAVPIIGSIAAVSSIKHEPVKTFFVRKKSKDHGTKDIIEGLGPNESLNGKNVLVIDDVATSGKSIHQAIQAVLAVGGIVKHAASLVNRDEGAAEMLAEHGVALHSIFHAREFAGTS